MNVFVHVSDVAETLLLLSRSRKIVMNSIAGTITAIKLSC
jgi:hypothetical protein